MRALLFLFVVGVLAMSDVARGDDKKFDPLNEKTYDEKVTVRKLNGKTFLNPVKNVPMHRAEFKGKTIFFTLPPAGNAQTPKGSEITDKDGVVYLVDEVVVSNNGYYQNYVSPKPKDK